MPRDSTISYFVDSWYTLKENCNKGMLKLLKIDGTECNKRVEAAKTTCPIVVAEDIPEAMDERQTHMLISRTKLCVKLIILGRAHDNELADKVGEKMWERGVEE